MVLDALFKGKSQIRAKMLEVDAIGIVSSDLLRDEFLLRVHDCHYMTTLPWPLVPV